MSQYRTRDGDMIDAICAAHYGAAAMCVAVYEANPHLAALGPVLPRGVMISLPERTPERPVAPIIQPVRLW